MREPPAPPSGRRYRQLKGALMTDSPAVLVARNVTLAPLEACIDAA